jgi:hypothetical protein
VGCSWGARFHAKERRYFCVLFREHFRCDGNLKHDRSAFRAEVAKTAMAWPKLGFGWFWPLRTSAAGLEGPRGIFRRQDAPKKLFKHIPERRYSLAPEWQEYCACGAHGTAQNATATAQKPGSGGATGARAATSRRAGISRYFFENVPGAVIVHQWFNAWLFRFWCQCAQRGHSVAKAGFWLVLAPPTSAAGLGSPRGIFRR